MWLAVVGGESPRAEDVCGWSHTTLKLFSLSLEVSLILVQNPLRESWIAESNCSSVKV